MEHPENTPENALEADAFTQQVASNLAAALQRFNELQAQIQALQATQETPNVSTTPPPLPAPVATAPPVYASLDPQAMATIAQIVAQTIQNQLPASVLSLLTPTPLTASATPVHLSEKLPDIPEYDGDRDKLDTWEHALIQRMHVNHD